MNLQESIERIHQMMGLIPESRSYLLRRFNTTHLNDKFNEALNYTMTQMGIISTLDKFKDIVINVMMDQLHGDLSNWGQEDYPYQEIHDFLTDAYSEKMVKAYRQMIDSIPDLNESIKDDIIKVLDREGINTASQLVSGYDNLIKLLDGYEIPKETKIKTIRDYLKPILGVNLLGIDEQPIPYKETNSEYHAIGYIGSNFVSVERWGGNKNQTFNGEYEVRYEDLPEKTIDDILDIVLNVLPNHDNL
jgi:Mg2+ and Co2+ transporter CorA